MAEGLGFRVQGSGSGFSIGGFWVEWFGSICARGMCRQAEIASCNPLHDIIRGGL